MNKICAYFKSFLLIITASACIYVKHIVRAYIPAKNMHKNFSDFQCANKLLSFIASPLIEFGWQKTHGW